MAEPLFEPAALERSSAGDPGLRTELLELFVTEADDLLAAARVRNLTPAEKKELRELLGQKTTGRQ